MFIILYVVFTTIQTINCDGNSLIAHFNLATEDGFTKCSVAPKQLSFRANQTAELKVIYNHDIKNMKCKVSDENYESKFELRLHDPRNNNITTFRQTVTKNLMGKWKCTLCFYIGEKLPENSNIKVAKDNTTTALCRLDVTVIDVSFCDNNKCLYICVGVGILVLGIIAGQSACVIYFRRKARSLRRLENLSARPRDKNDKARYSENPKKKPLIPETQGRESIIYEALDNVRLPLPPEPPALETLPRTPKPSKTSTDTASSSKADTDSESTEVDKPKEKFKPFAGTKKFSLPALVLTKNQTEEKQRSFSIERPRVKPKPSENKRTTLERIKERPPLPLPIPQTLDEPGEYEDMSTSPTRNPEPVKSNFQKQKSPSTLKKALPNPKPQIKPVKPIVPPPMQNKPKKSLVPPKSDTVTELENILKKNIKLNPTSPTRTLTKTTPSPKPTIPPLPKPGAVITKPIASPMDAPVPPPISTLPRPKVSSPVEKVAPVAFKAPKPTPMNAPVPPPISTLPKAAIPTPEEPEAYTNSSDEEWTYEPLEPYNIYSM